jgi:hypothetical protein
VEGKEHAGDTNDAKSISFGNTLLTALLHWYPGGPVEILRFEVTEGSKIWYHKSRNYEKYQKLIFIATVLSEYISEHRRIQSQGSSGVVRPALDPPVSVDPPIVAILGIVCPELRTASSRRRGVPGKDSL